MQLAELVDLSLYPIDRLDDAGEDLLESCRKSLQGSALCYLPNFLTTRGLAQLQAEVMSVQQLAYRNCAPRPPYAWRDQARYPSEHVVAQRLPQSLGSVTRDCFEADRTLFRYSSKTLRCNHTHRLKAAHVSRHGKANMSDNSEALATARDWMQRYPVVDGIGAGPTSEQAVVDLVAGGVDAVHWSVGGHAEVASWCHWPLAGAGDTTKSALLNMVLQRWLVRRLPEQCVLARSVADIEAAKRNSCTAIIHGWQGAQPIEENPSLLEIFYELGLRIVQIHHNYETSLGFGCYEPRDHGLKRLGFDVLAICNQLGIVIDGSHTGERTALDMIDASAAPLIFSHSNPKAVREHPRNISDRLIKACSAHGGVVGCNVFSDFVSDTKDGYWPSVDDWVHCVDHIVDTIGIEHVAIGSDLCMHPHGEIIWDNSSWGGVRKPFAEDEIQGMDHTHRNFALLIAALVRRGYREEDTAKIMGGNWLRVYREVWGG